MNTVNCVGIMGRGITLQLKNAFPENFRNMLPPANGGEVQPGKMLVFETHELTSPRFIIAPLIPGAFSSPVFTSQ